MKHTKAFLEYYSVLTITVVPPSKNATPSVWSYKRGGFSSRRQLHSILLYQCISERSSDKRRGTAVFGH